MKAYEKLLEPITIGTHQWRNRMVKAPSSAMSWDPGQFCNERIIGLYDAISKGGASAIILGGMICDDPATLIDDADGGVYTVETYPLGGLYDDKFIPGLSQLADAVHGNGCELIAQIFQNGAAIKTKGGAWCSSTLTADELPSPEPYCNPTRGLSLEEIEAFKDRYFAAAERAKKAGLDGIEHSLPLPEAVNRNLFHPSAAAGLDSLPRTLREAITVAGQSEFISRELPVALMNKYFEYQTQLCHDAEGAPDTESWERAHSFLII